MGTKRLREEETPQKYRRPATSFNFPDLTFLDVDRHTIPQSWQSELRDVGVEFFQLQWHTQKNLNNVENIYQGRYAEPRICSVIEALIMT